MTRDESEVLGKRGMRDATQYHSITRIESLLTSWQWGSSYDIRMKETMCIIKCDHMEPHPQNTYVYFPAVAPPLATAGVADERRTPAPTAVAPNKFSKTLRRSTILSAMVVFVVLGETEYARLVVARVAKAKQSMTAREA